MTRNTFISMVTLIGMILILALLLWDTNSSTIVSLNDRISLLEEKMIERVKPIIQINRATIYNTEGEIVVEGLDK